MGALHSESVAAVLGVRVQQPVHTYHFAAAGWLAAGVMLMRLAFVFLLPVLQAAVGWVGQQRSKAGHAHIMAAARNIKLDYIEVSSSWRRDDTAPMRSHRPARD